MVNPLDTKNISPDERVTYFAETDARNRRTPFGIKVKDRSRHVYVIGKTGMGKSTLLENMAIQDIQNGEGLAFIDPHGKTADLLLDYVPKERVNDVVYFAPFDAQHPISFNVMEDVGDDKRHLVVSGLMSAFKKIWVDAWSARMEYILTNTLLALLEYPGATLLSINRMFADKDFRKKVVDNVTDTTVKSFWVDEFAKYTDRFAAEATPAIQNKVGQFVSNPIIRNIVGQPKSSFDLRKMMDERKIVIINLSKGLVGEQNANLLGSMLITKMYLAAMSRADSSTADLHKLPFFSLYVDEFQSFANESFADILSEARKYKLSLVLAHQYIEQMSEEVRAAVFGNVGTMISFRVGAFDAEVLEKEFAPEFTAEDMVNLGFAQIYLKLMIDQVSSPPFSARTLPPIKEPEVSYRDRIVEHSRATYAKPRAEVEQAIKEWHGLSENSKGTRAEERPKEKKDFKKAETGGSEKRAPRSAVGDPPAGGHFAGPRPEPDRAPENKPAPNPFKDLKINEEGRKREVSQEDARKNSPRPPQESVSLQSMKDRALNTKKDAKGPSPERLAELRNTLSSVLEKAGQNTSRPEQKPSSSKPSQQEKASSRPPRGSEKAGKAASDEKPEKPGEVPETVLKKMLRVDKE